MPFWRLSLRAGGEREVAEGRRWPQASHGHGPGGWHRGPRVPPSRGRALRPRRCGSRSRCWRGSCPSPRCVSMMVAEAPASTSITLRVAMVRGAASVAMKTSSIGVSTLPDSVRCAPSVAKAAFISCTGSVGFGSGLRRALVGAAGMCGVIGAVDEDHAGRRRCHGTSDAFSRRSTSPASAVTCWRGG